jgi:prevent-host-death family protein
MKTLPVGEFKARFSQVISDVQDGEEIAISYGKRKDRIAVVVPYSKYKQQNQIRLGLLEARGGYEIFS